MSNKNQRPANFRLRKLDASSAPDWREWKLIPRGSVRHVCLLSLNLNPHRIHENAWPDDAGEDYYDEFFLRLRVLDANLESDPERFSGNRFHTHVVRLPEFAAWAMSVGWDIPAELAAIAKAPLTETAAPAAPVEVSHGETANEEEDNDGTTANDSKQAKEPPPVTADVVMEAFPTITWGDSLSKVSETKYKWLNSSVRYEGSPRPGDAKKFSLANVAFCLVGAPKKLPRNAAYAIIKKHPEWLPEWDKLSEYLPPNN